MYTGVSAAGLICHPIEKHCSGIDTGVLIDYPGEIRFSTDPPFRYVFFIFLEMHDFQHSNPKEPKQ
jgi:hypothetical protein